MSTKVAVLVTGGAGFIGSHIVDTLLAMPEVAKVRVLDNLATGSKENIAHLAGEPRFEFMEGDIRDMSVCQQAVEGIHAITHQAALGSVPRSINDPVTSNAVNVSGTLNIFQAAREAGIKRVVYASSSSVYGNSPVLPKVEHQTGQPLSPYAVTKWVDELYANVFGKLYGMELIGLRYFNVFGPRQNPNGPYAAVIPLFVKALQQNISPKINGDGSQSRDFTYVANAVQANIRGLFTQNPEAFNQAYNVACGSRATLLELLDLLKKTGNKPDIQPEFGPSRAGDVAHSLADISKAAKLLGYQPAVQLPEGLQLAWEWYTR